LIGLLTEGQHVFSIYYSAFRQLLVKDAPQTPATARPAAGTAARSRRHFRLMRGAGVHMNGLPFDTGENRPPVATAQDVPARVLRCPSIREGTPIDRLTIMLLTYYTTRVGNSGRILF